VHRKTDPCQPKFFAPSAENDTVAVLEEGAGFVTTDLNRPAAAALSSSSDPPLGVGPTECRSEQIAGAQVAAIDVWCATSCAIVQYACRKVVDERRCGGSCRSRMPRFESARPAGYRLPGVAVHDESR